MNRERKRLPGCLAVALTVVAALACYAVVPNIGRALQIAADNRCVADLHSMETALAKLITDANVKDIRGLFDANEFARARESYAQRAGLDAFEASAEIYTVVLATLLRHGQHAVEDLSASEDTKHLARVLKQDVLPRAGQHYLDVRKDPWGTAYRFFGPWPEGWGPVVFRIHRIPDEPAPATQADALTVAFTGDDGSLQHVGLPPQPPGGCYVWSFGPNGVSDQARFDSSGRYDPPPSRHYRADASAEYLGGGDDLNNWDQGQSWMEVHEAMSPYRRLWYLVR